MIQATLEDLKLELWLRRREIGSLQWTTKDGINIPIKNMGIRHLVNTIKMLERNAQEENDYLEALGSIGDTWL